jgi:hypothetical protein
MTATPIMNAERIGQVYPNGRDALDLQVEDILVLPDGKTLKRAALTGW